jgi:hypothetical protein
MNMSEEQKAASNNLLVDYLNGRISRAQLFKAAGAGVALAAVPGVAAAAPNVGRGDAPGISFPFFPQVPTGSYTTEQIQDIFNVAITAEYLAVTVLTQALTTYAGQLQLNTLAKTLVQAIVVEEQVHLDFLAAAGAKPAATSFTIPPQIFASSGAFFTGGEALESLFVAAYMTAAREFAELGQPNLVKYAFQAGAVEAEHRALIRGVLFVGGAPTASPPNNKAFETDLLLYVRDAVPIVTALGLLGGSAPSVSYPGRDAALAAAGATAAGVIQKSPNNATSSVTFSGFSSLTGERS